jgi:hypothetical protein
LVISVGGPLNGGPEDERSIKKYLEVLKILKKDGEVRVYNPYIGRGGMDTFLYKLAKNKKIINPNFDQIKFNDIESKINRHFLINYFDTLSKEKQIEYSNILTKEFEDKLNNLGEDVKLKLGEPEKENNYVNLSDGDIYNPYLIIKKMKGNK